MKRTPKIEVVSYPKANWWRLIVANGETVCVSGLYASRSTARRAAKRVQAIMKEAVVK